MSDFSLLGILALSLIPAYATFFFVSCLCLAISPFLFPEWRARITQERDDAIWANHEAVEHANWAEWQSMKIGLEQKRQQRADEERQRLESLRHEPGYETLNENLKHKEDFHRRLAAGERRTVKEVEKRATQLTADNKGISVEALLVRQERAARNGETLDALEEREHIARKKWGLSLDEYEAKQQRDDRRLKRLVKRARQLGISTDEMVARRRMEAQRQGIGLEDLERRHEEEEEEEKKRKVERLRIEEEIGVNIDVKEVDPDLDQPYPNPSDEVDSATKANTLANTGARRTWLGSMAALVGMGGTSIAPPDGDSAAVASSTVGHAANSRNIVGDKTNQARNPEISKADADSHNGTSTTDSKTGNAIIPTVAPPQSSQHHQTKKVIPENPPSDASRQLDQHFRRHSVVPGAPPPDAIAQLGQHHRLTDVVREPPPPDASPQPGHHKSQGYLGPDLHLPAAPAQLGHHHPPNSLFPEPLPLAQQDPTTFALANDANFWAMVDRRAAEHRLQHGCSIAFCRLNRTDIPLRYAPFQRNLENVHPTADVRLTKRIEAEEKRKGAKAAIREAGRLAFGLVRVQNGKRGERRWTDKKARRFGLEREDVKKKVAVQGGCLAEWGVREDGEPEDHGVVLLHEMGRGPQ